MIFGVSRGQSLYARNPHLRWETTDHLLKEKCAYMIQPTELGCRIAAKRRARGLTQGQVAIHMGVSPQAVSKWERGLACPDLVFLDDLADLLDVTIEELLLGRPAVTLASA